LVSQAGRHAGLKSISAVSKLASMVRALRGLLDPLGDLARLSTSSPTVSGRRVVQRAWNAFGLLAGAKAVSPGLQLDLACCCGPRQPGRLRPLVMASTDLSALPSGLALAARRRQVG